MKRICVICNKILKNSATHCCTPTSLITVEEKGFFKHRFYYYSIEGKALGSDQVEKIREREFKILKEHTRTERLKTIYEKLNSAFDQIGSSAIYQKSNDPRFIDPLRNIDLTGLLTDLARLIDTSGLLKLLKRAFDTLLFLKHISRYASTEYNNFASKLINSISKLLPASLPANLQVTNDIESVVNYFNGFRDVLITDNEEEYLRILLNGLNSYIKSNWTRLSDDQLILITKLNIETQESGCDLDGNSYQDIRQLNGLIEISRNASEELARRRNS